MDLVGTCPKNFWEYWLEEGDCAGEPDSGTEYEWTTSHSLIKKINTGDRFYVVSHGKLRGYAIVTNVEVNRFGAGAILRKGGAVACTIDAPIPGFRGLRMRWWKHEDEKPFPSWEKP